MAPLKGQVSSFPIFQVLGLLFLSPVTQPMLLRCVVWSAAVLQVCAPTMSAGDGGHAGCRGHRHCLLHHDLLLQRLPAPGPGPDYWGLPSPGQYAEFITRGPVTPWWVIIEFVVLCLSQLAQLEIQSKMWLWFHSYLCVTLKRLFSIYIAGVAIEYSGIFLVCSFVCF